MNYSSNILIIDDESINRILIKSFLKAAGYNEPYEAESTLDAFQILGKDAEQANPHKIDLILMDILMPHLNGIEGCRLLKKDKRLCDIPVIMVTALSEKRFLESAFDAGAIDYISKPVERSILSSRIRSALALKHEMDLRKTKEREILEIGSRIQKTLLTGQSPEHFPGVYLATLSIPSQDIAGDFYDFFYHNNQCLDIIIGDVMGKGVPAALIGAITKTQFLKAFSRYVAYSIDESPLIEDIVMLVHKKLTKELSNLGKFVTMCYARLNLSEHMLEFIDCGHTRTIHYKRSIKQCQLLEGNNVPLGMREEEQYEKFIQPIESGDILVFYSDGITEVRSPSGELFGEKRLSDFVQNNANSNPDSMLQSLKNSIFSFSESKEFKDDFTCIIVKIEEKPKMYPMQVSLQLSNNLNEIKRLRHFIHDICNKAGKRSFEDLFPVEIAIVETFVNIVKHGELKGNIDIISDIFKDRISITFKYPGKRFSPDKSPLTPSETELKEGGFGLYIIEKSMNKVSYFQDADDKNNIVLEKLFK